MKGYEFGFNLEKNVSTKERIASVASGAFLVINGLTGRKSAKQILSGGFLLFRGITGHCHLYNMFMRKKELTDDGKIIVRTSVTVQKSRKEVYNFWRKLETLPLFMKHLESVKVIDKTYSTWKMKILPGLSPIEWTSEIIKDNRNNMIAWESIPGSQIENTGVVEFKDAGSEGTELLVEIAYKAPAGKIGEGVAHILNPVLRKMIKNDIKWFRKFVETGELPVNNGIERLVPSN